MKNIKNLKKEKVEWKKLWEVTVWNKKFTGVEKYKQPKINKCYHYFSKDLKELVSKNGKIKILTTNFSNIFADEEKVKANILEDEVVCIPGGGNPIVQYYNGKFITGDNRIATSYDKNKLNNKYLFYYLNHNIELIREMYRGGTIKHPDMSKILEIPIPLPPLKKQEAIAAALDKFTELTEELTAREAQYDYYRKMLLSQEWIEKEEGEEVEWKALEEIFDTRTGYTPSKKIKSYWENGTVDWFTIEDINQKGRNLETANVKISETGVKGELFKGNSVVLSTNASVGKYALIKNDFTINQQFMVFTAKKEYSDFLNMEFTKYYFSQISEYCLKNLREGKFPSVDLKKLLKFKFPIPSLKTQQKIVNILDSFETLVNDIKQGLPREIELRQKQYEYYREKLLTFN